MILKGASGIAAALPFSLISSTTGLGLAGKVWNNVGGGLTDELKVRLPGGAFGNAVIAQIVEIGGIAGDYAYQLAAPETATAGKVYYYPNVAGYDSNPVRFEDVLDIPTAIAIRDAILDYPLRTGRTLRGHWRRMDALYFGKVTGLLSALATAFRPGGGVAEFTATQNVPAGTREEVDVTGSEAP